MQFCDHGIGSPGRRLLAIKYPIYPSVGTYCPEQTVDPDQMLQNMVSDQDHLYQHILDTSVGS